MKHDSSSFCIDTQKLILFSNLQKVWKLAKGVYLIFNRPGCWEICVPFEPQKNVKNPENNEVAEYYGKYESCGASDTMYGVWQCISDYPL